MTNKEFIQNEIDNLKSMLKNAKDFNCETIIKNCEEEIEQYNQVLKDLERLEAIDNAKPSEALKCLKKNEELFDEIALENPTTYKDGTVIEAFLFKTNTAKIEQALIKAQEQDKILEILTNNEVDIESFKIAFIEYEDDYDDYYYHFQTYSRYRMEKNEFNLLVEYLKKFEEEIDNDK